MTRRLPSPCVLARFLTALVLFVAMASPVAAVEPLRLQGEVTDQADVLSAAEERRVADTLAEVRADDGVQLFIAYIDTSGADDIDTWATDTAALSSLGGNDALIVVAIDDRTYSMWVGPSLDALTDDEIDSILVDHLEPGLVAGNFAAAAEDAAVATGEAATGAVTAPTGAPPTTAAGTATPTSEPGAGGASDNSGGVINITALLAVLLVIGGAVLVVRTVLVRRREAKARSAALDQLNAEANHALLAADEALKDAGNDVEFAAAQWGEAEVDPYREAIRQAGEELRASFAVRQKLDDAYPEKPPERDRMLREIIARCTGAQQLLDAQEQRFDDLRDLQEVAPRQLEAMPATIGDLRVRRQAAEATMARLQQAYAPAAVTSVEGNLAEATKVLDAADDETARGQAAVGASPAEGVVALRRAQEAVARATQLVEAVERLAASLDGAAARLPAELDAAARDLSAARDAVARLGQLPSTPPVAPGSPAIDPVAALRAAETAFAEAQRAAAARPLEPLGAVQAALAANQAADTIMAQVADARAQAARRRQVADAAIASAQSHVTRAVDFITTRRHGVGETARTRAAEAEMRLQEARSVAGDNPEGAAAAANRALALADEAYRLAAGEFDGWNRAGTPVAGPYAPPGAGSEVMGAVIGGILGGMLSGGGRGAGWGGSPWGRSGGRASRGGFGASRGPMGGGVFGGGGRSRGGSFGAPRGGGGGGGRVRGGRW